jgi:hypothetical protein
MASAAEIAANRLNAREGTQDAPGQGGEAAGPVAASPRGAWRYRATSIGADLARIPTLG